MSALDPLLVLALLGYLLVLAIALFFVVVLLRGWVLDAREQRARRRARLAASAARAMEGRPGRE